MNRPYPCRFGPYVLAGPFGEGGGMVDVWLALMGTPGLERPCVIKKLIPIGGTEGEALERRFRQRGDIARRLSHGAIAQTISAGENEGEFFIVEEFIAGKDLTEIPKAALSLGLVIHIVREVGRALAYVHNFENLDFVHRDVAPANIRLSYTGEVKLLDFGMTSSPQLALGVTQPGEAFGRVAYAAPELVAGASADRRSDIYALGVILWELLSRRNFSEETIAAISRGEGQPISALPPSRFNHDVPQGLDAVVLCALAQEPNERFACVEDLRSALDAFLPNGLDGEKKIRELLANRDDFEDEQRRIKALIEKARPLLESDSFIRAMERDASPLQRGLVMTVGALVLVLLAGVLMIGILGWPGR